MNGQLLRQRIDIYAILSVIVPLAIYLLTLAPSVTFFDSGEFLTAIFSLGTAHSPGYPLFITYAKPFTYLPLGNIAFRINFATAFSGALACFGAFLLTRHLLRDENLADDPRLSERYRNWAALAAALTFAGSPRLWLQSNHDKPYPLISFLAAIVLFLVLRWRERYRQGEELPSLVYLGAFLCGLAFAAHQTIILLLPAYAFLLLVVDWRLLTRVREMVLAVAFALLGFSIHAHLPVRATRNPLLNWGDSKTLEQFLWNLLRKGYPVEKPQRTLDLLWQQVNAFNVPHEFTWVGLAVMLFGMAVFLRRRRDEVIAYLISLVSFLLVIVGYFNTPGDLIFLTEEFFTPLYLYSAVFVGLGLFALVRLALAPFREGRVRSLLARTVAGALLLALPVTVCALNYVENDQHLNYVAYDYATNTLRSLDQGAVLYTWGDSGAFPLWYLQGAEMLRDDVDLLHTPHLVFSWYLDGFPHLFRSSFLRMANLEALTPESALLLSISEMLERRPVFIDFSTRYSVALESFRLAQRGIVYQVLKGSTTGKILPDSAIWNLYTIRGVEGDLFFRDLDTGKALMIYANSAFETGDALLLEGQLGQGVPMLRLAERLDPALRLQVSQALRRIGVQ